MPWAPEYIDADDLKGFIRVGDVLDDAELVLMAAAANRVVDRAAGRQFGSVAAEARSYPVRYDRRLGRWVAEVDDLQSDVGAVYPSGVDPPTLWPRNAVSVGLAWTHMRWTADPSDDDGMVTVTAARGSLLGVSHRSASRGRRIRGRSCGCWPGLIRMSWWPWPTTGAPGGPDERRGRHG